MKLATNLLTFVLQTYILVMTSASTIRGSTKDQRDLMDPNFVLPNRKQPLESTVAKLALKLPRSTLYEIKQYVKPTQPPTKAPTIAPTPVPTVKPTMKPNPALDIVGDNGNPGNSFPLKRCQGDCDNDADCEGDLKCFQREGIEEVPGCEGSGSGGKDYCSDMKYNRTPQGTGLGDQSYRFQLRLYWEPSYFWQETHKETWWCLECTECDQYSLGDGPKSGCEVVGRQSSSCSVDDNIWIRKCKNTDRVFEWTILKNPGSGDQVQAYGTNLCLSTVDNVYLEMKLCDKGSSRQLFKNIESLDKFELRPYYQRSWNLNSAKCLSQLHHPKDKELVGLHRCKATWHHETMYWEEFHR